MLFQCSSHAHHSSQRLSITSQHTPTNHLHFSSLHSTLWATQLQTSVQHHTADTTILLYPIVAHLLLCLIKYIYIYIYTYICIYIYTVNICIYNVTSWYFTETLTWLFMFTHLYPKTRLRNIWLCITNMTSCHVYYVVVIFVMLLSLHIIYVAIVTFLSCYAILLSCHFTFMSVHAIWWSCNVCCWFMYFFSCCFCHILPYNDHVMFDIVRWFNWCLFLSCHVHFIQFHEISCHVIKLCYECCVFTRYEMVHVTSHYYTEFYIKSHHILHHNISGYPIQGLWGAEVNPSWH